jgi:hypothetical protein
MVAIDPVSCGPCAEAADTITRLTEEVERLNKSRNCWGQKYNKLLNAVRTENAYGVYAEARDTYRKNITELAAENEKLRNDVRLAVMSDSKECTAISEVNARLTAENERLREALEFYAAWPQRPQGNLAPLLLDAGQKARAATTKEPRT